MGKNDIEDALKRLDRLTQEEARMAAAQLLKVTNTIDNRVAGVGERVTGMVAAVDDGAQYIFLSVIVRVLTHNAPRCKKGRGSYATSSQRLGRQHRSSKTFVISEPH